MSGCGLSAIDTEMNNRLLFPRSTHLGEEGCLMEDESSSRPSFSTDSPCDLEQSSSLLEGSFLIRGTIEGH